MSSHNLDALARKPQPCLFTRRGIEDNIEDTGCMVEVQDLACNQ